MTGVIGSFVIDETGAFVSNNLPKELVEKADKLSKLLFYVASVMKATRPFERIIVTSENLTVVAMLVRNRILVVVAEKDINIPLLKLVTNIVVSKLREEKALTTKKKMPLDEVNKLCNYYDLLYGLAAKKLMEIFGSESPEMFSKKLKGVTEDHPKLLASVGFGLDGKPKIARLKMNAGEVTRDELVAGLEDLLVSMLETIKETAGAHIADKTIDEIIKIKERNRGEIF